MEKETHEDVLREVGPAGIAALAEAWASMSRGHLEDFQRERDEWQTTGKLDRDAPGYTGRWEGYTADAEELIKRMRSRGFTIVPVAEKNDAERLRKGLQTALEAYDQGRRVERGPGGMTIEAQIRRSVINGVPAWPIEEARDALFPVPDMIAEEHTNGQG